MREEFTDEHMQKAKLVLAKYPPNPQTRIIDFFSDRYNALQLVAYFGHKIRFCNQWRQWLVYNGSQWKEDDLLVVAEMTKETVDKMLDRVTKDLKSVANKKEERNQVLNKIKIVLKCFSQQKLKAMSESARSIPQIAIRGEQLDKDHWLFNNKGGTINLKTGQLQPHNPEDLITKLSPIIYDPEAKCPLWERFLDEIMDGNKDLIGFLQRAVGLSMTGDVSEHYLFILYGTGRNGKTTFLNTILALMGDYGMTATPDLLIAKKYEQHPTELADLFGKRFVVSMESGQGRRLDEPLVKQLTGSDSIRARRMREDYWEFKPSHKLWLATNHKPQIPGTDIAIWDRVKIIPFNVSFQDGDPRQDKKLPEKLLTELPGILNWCLEGCLAWQKNGLGIPEEIATATKTYQKEQDILAVFIDEKCLIDRLVKMQVGDLYAEYVKWCEEEKERPLRKKDFRAHLLERGFRTEKGTGNKTYWFGIKTLANSNEAQDVWDSI